MVALETLTLLFVAGIITALAIGLGTLPFFLVEDVSDRWNVALWGLASCIMSPRHCSGSSRRGPPTGIRCSWIQA